MRWMDRRIPMSREWVIHAIQTQDGLRAGKAPALNNGWVWVRVTGLEKEEVTACEEVRDCTETEKRVLDDLLKGEIVCRMLRLEKEGLSWSLACID